MPHPILDLLRANYGWDVLPPHEVAEPYWPIVDRAVAEGRAPEAICGALNAQVLREGPPPVGHALPYGVFGYKLYKTFGGGAHYKTLSTSQALGYQPQSEPFKGKPPAIYAEDALTLMRHGWRFDGQSQFIDLSTPEGRAEYDRRAEWATMNRPRPWNKVDNDLWVYLVMTGEIPTKNAPFGSKPATPYEWVFGLDLQKYMDNQWESRRMRVPRWNPDGSKNPYHPDAEGNR